MQTRPGRVCIWRPVRLPSLHTEQTQGAPGLQLLLTAGHRKIKNLHQDFITSPTSFDTETISWPRVQWPDRLKQVSTRVAQVFARCGADSGRRAVGGTVCPPALARSTTTADQHIINQTLRDLAVLSLTVQPPHLSYHRQTVSCSGSNFKRPAKSNHRHA